MNNSGGTAKPYACAVAEHSSIVSLKTKSKTFDRGSIMTKVIFILFKVTLTIKQKLLSHITNH